MSQLTIRTEAGDDVGGIERGEIAQRGQTETAQHIGQVGTVERTNRQRRQEPLPLARTHDVPGPRSALSCVGSASSPTAVNGPSPTPTRT